MQFCFSAGKHAVVALPPVPRVLRAHSGPLRPLPSRPPSRRSLFYSSSATNVRCNGHAIGRSPVLHKVSILTRLPRRVQLCLEKKPKYSRMRFQSSPACRGGCNPGPGANDDERNGERQCGERRCGERPRRTGDGQHPLTKPPDERGVPRRRSDPGPLKSNKKGLAAITQRDPFS